MSAHPSATTSANAALGSPLRPARSPTPPAPTRRPRRYRSRLRRPVRAVSARVSVSSTSGVRRTPLLSNRDLPYPLGIHRIARPLWCGTMNP